MIRTVSQIQSEFADREAIRDCLYRYSRGIDRCDMEILRSAYWPDALDDHTGAEGGIEDFVAWAEPRLRRMQHTVHMIGNILIKMDGHIAAVESYVWSASVTSHPTREIVTAGRYLDRFERRMEEWRIAARSFVHDWFHESAETGDLSAAPSRTKTIEVGAFRPHDRSYTWLGL